MKNEIEESIKTLAVVASKQAKSEDAQKFGQAALNLAHVLATLDCMERSQEVANKQTEIESLRAKLAKYE